MQKKDNISSKKEIVEYGVFNIPQDYYKYIKGIVIAKYKGKIIDKVGTLQEINSISRVFDLKFISDGNTIFDEIPQYSVYPKSNKILNLFQFPGKVPIEIKNEEKDKVEVERYEISYEKIELVDEFQKKQQIPCQGMFHQRDENTEFGTFKGDAVLTYKHTKIYQYIVKINDALQHEISLYDSQNNIVDTVISEHKPIQLYTKNNLLFLETAYCDYIISQKDLKLTLTEVNVIAIPTKDVENLSNEKKTKTTTKKITPHYNYQEKGGCLSLLLEIIGWLFVVVFYGGQLLAWGFVLFQLFSEFPFLLIILGVIGVLVLLNWLLPKVINKVFVPIGNFLAKAIAPILAVIFISWLVFSTFNSLSSLSSTERRKFNYSEDSPKENKETIYERGNELIKVHRIWEDYEKNEYEITFYLKLNDIEQSTVNKNNVITEFTYQQETNVYKSLLPNEAVYLNDLINKLDSIKTVNSLTNKEFAKVLMSFVQDIPYALVLQNGCVLNLNQNDNFVRNYLLEGGKCIGNEKFGILSPTEFMFNTEGDCDTRTVFSYLTFKHFGYDVAVFNSNVYAHSIFGINMEEKQNIGVYKLIDDKKYFLWETTSKGFDIGEIPSEIGNVNYWYKVLN